MSQRDRNEHIARRNEVEVKDMFPNVTVQMMASEHCDAAGLSTALLNTQSGGVVPYHTHECSECITPLKGNTCVEVEGRRYLLNPGDSIHVPAGIPHTVDHADNDSECLMHCAFGSSVVTREFLDRPDFKKTEVLSEEPNINFQEHVVRSTKGECVESTAGAVSLTLFDGSMGAEGLCGGYSEFQPGTAIACHFHPYDESISIVKGEAVCEVDGRSYRLADCDTAMIPEGICHRFLNDTNELMAMIWVYAGERRTRTVVDECRCSK
ncbi:MAG: Quercetin 2,3-dioxygenase [Candidatus Moanabacter tarae]|uniref:Quercetin 2,3-dioxygenase n=1 Tax=Candidatus Moanibacter tarae TaxID=2200854 RepID=A0A2Z4ADZ1_9BACT|nr:MAG: Quercetin 2,3-dioxygenase [Candidatus Moanabacter tarae]